MAAPATPLIGNLRYVREHRALGDLDMLRRREPVLTDIDTPVLRRLRKYAEATIGTTVFGRPVTDIVYVARKVAGWHKVTFVDGETRTLSNLELRKATALAGIYCLNVWPAPFFLPEQISTWSVADDHPNCRCLADWGSDDD